MKLVDLKSGYSLRDTVSDRIDIVGGEEYEFDGSNYLRATNINTIINESDYKYIVRIRWFDSLGSETGTENSTFDPFDDLKKWNKVVPSGTASSDAATAQLEISTKDDEDNDNRNVVNAYWDETFIEPLNYTVGQRN